MARSLLWIGRVVLILAVVTAAIIGAGVLYLRSDGGRAFLARAISEAASEPGGTQVTIGRIGAGLPLRIAVADVTVADSGGTWLSLDTASLAWKPAALLGGRLHVTEVSGSGLDISRLPASDEAEAEAEEDLDLSLPALPLDVTIDQLVVDDIDIGEPVAGEAMRLRLSGRIATDIADTVQSELRLERLDGGGTSLVADAEFDPRARTLRLEANAWEPAGGAVGHLLGLEPSPALSLSLQGSGPLDAWRGRLEAMAEGVAETATDIEIDEGNRLHLAGFVSVPGLLQPDLRSLAGERIAFIGTAEMDDDAVVLESLEVRSAAATLTADGRLSSDDEHIDARVKLTLTDPSRIAPLAAPASLGGAQIEAAAAGPLDTPEVTLTARIDDLRLPEAAVEAVELSASAVPRAVALGSLRLDATLRAIGIRLADAGAQAAIGDEAVLTVEGDVETAEPAVMLRNVALTAAAARLVGQAEYAGSTGRLDATADIAVDDLRALEPLVGMPLAGTAAGTAEVSGEVETPNLSGKVSLALADPSFGDALIDGFVGSSATVSTEFSLEGEEELRIGEIAVDTETASLRGRVRLTDGLAALDAEAELQLASLAPLSEAIGEPVSGRLTATATAGGPLEDPTIRAHVIVPEAQVADIVLSEFDAKASVTSAVTAPTGDVALSGRSPYGPISLSTAFAAEGAERLRLSRIDVRGAGLEVSGDLAVPLGPGVYEGRIGGRWQPGPTGFAVAGQRLAGRASVEFRFLGQDAAQALEFDLDASDLDVAAGGERVFSADSIVLRGGVTDALGSPVVRLSANGSDLEAGGMALKTLNADVSGGLDNAAFNVAAEGFAEPVFNLAATGTLGVEDDLTRVQLATFETRAGSHAATLRRPARIEIGGDGYRVTDLALAIGEGNVTADVALGGARSTARIVATDVPLGIASIAAPDLDLAGALNADVDIGTEGSLLGGRFTVSLRNLVQDGDSLAGVPPLEVSLDGTWRGGEIAAEASIGGFSDTPVLASARVPLAVEARTLQPRTRGDAPISATVRWEGEVEPLIEALPMDEHRLNGLGRIVLDVAGTMSNPQVGGDVVLEGVTYENLTMGTLIRDLQARVEADGSRTFRIEASGNDGAAGTLAVRGFVDLTNAEKADIEVEANVNNAVLVRRDDVTANATGDVSFVDAPSGGRIEGRITANDIRVRLIDQLPPSVVDFEVVEIRSAADAEAARQREPPAAGGMELDLTVDMPRRVFVTGRGLESEWGGNIEVSGTTERPVVLGSIRIIRGRFEFADKEFELTRGDIDFTGGREIDPRIDIVAEHSGDDVTAVIGVSGQSSDPSIDISSREGVPTSEVLPRALFGKSAADLSAGEALKLAVALDGLRGGGSLTDSTIGSIQETIGLDVLSVDPGIGGGGPSVRAGRYVSDDIYIETRQGSEPGTSKYRAEYQITPEISAEAEFGDPTDSRQGVIGLKWQTDY